jgi:succinate dehydrogenase/fumarate reductase cytochrome b subunit
MAHKDYFMLYLLKTGRITGWVLFVLVLAYLLTGYAMCGKFDVSRLISKAQGEIIHKNFDLVLLWAFAMHAGISMYFALRRWGWIKYRPKR